MGSPILVLSGLILPHNISPEIQSRLPDLVAALGPTRSQGPMVIVMACLVWAVLAKHFLAKGFVVTFVVNVRTTKERVQTIRLSLFGTAQLDSGAPMAHRGWQTTLFGFVESLVSDTFQIQQTQLRFFFKRWCRIGCVH